MLGDHTGIGLGVIAPVVAWMKHRLGITDRDMQPRVTVFGARLEQQYLVTAAGRQTICSTQPAEPAPTMM